jgi:uncharacterized protein
MAKDLQCSLEDLIRKPALRKMLNIKKYISETVGQYTIEDILKELEKPGRDPRQVIEEFRFDENIKSIEDLRPGMTVPGIVTNITKFGAFVDIGVKQDGLVHISQLSNSFITDANEAVKLQQRVMVTVTEVDVARKRIALSMKDNKPQPQGRNEANNSKRPGAVPDNKMNQKKTEPLNPFQAKLMELKKKFD